MKLNAKNWLIIGLPLALIAVMLFPTWRYSSLNGERSAISDSTQLAAWDREYNESYQNAKDGRIKLGLDLRGGMYVTLEVDVLKLIEESASRDAIDEVFEEVIAATRKEVANSDEPVIDAFLRNFQAKAAPQGRSLFSYFDAGEGTDLSEDKIVEKLRRDADEAIDQALEVLRQRIDKYGVSEPSIQKVGSRRIVVELPDVTDEQEVRSLISTTARLEFKLVRNNAALANAFYRIDQLLAAESKGKGTAAAAAPAVDSASVAPDSGATAVQATPADTAAAVASADTTKKDTGAVAAKSDTAKDPYAGLSEQEAQKRYQEDHPFTTLFASYLSQNGNFQQIAFTQATYPETDYFFQLPGANLSRFQAILSRPDVRRILGTELDVAISARPDERIEKQSGQKVYEIYGLKGEAELTGEAITDAVATFDPTSNQPMVLMSMGDSDGSEKWARITGANIGKRIAVVLDGQVYSAPTVQNKITGGRSQITGSRNIEEARLLQIILKAGALKAPVQVIEERVVGPSLGEDSIQSGLWSSAFAFLFVIVFMALYYSAAGLVANVAVLVNVGLILALLTAFKGTLTLPGIAGLILTIGMAVDANILIYERIREELAKGRSMHASINEGFSKAFSAIIDSNVTTLITGVILLYLGQGPVQGFGLTIVLGIFMTLFAGLMLTRAILTILTSGSKTIGFGQPAQSHS